MMQQTAEDFGMRIEVLPHRAFDLVTRREVDTGQYRIMINGEFVGVLPHFDGAQILLHERRSPMELKAIENEVRKQVIPQRIGGIAQPSLVPQDAEKTRPLNAGDFE